MAKKRRYVVEADTFDNRCSVRFANGAVRHYWAPQSGGYVRDITRQPGVLGTQIFDARGPIGTTLIWDGACPLADLMRRQLRALARDDLALDCLIGEC